MSRQKRAGDQTDPQGERRRSPVQIKAPWYFEATLRQEVNRRETRRGNLQRIFKGVIRFGVPAAGVMVLAIAAVAGFRRDATIIREPTLSPLPAIQATDSTSTIEKNSVPEKPPTVRVVQERRSVSARPPGTKPGAEQSLLEEERTEDPEVVPVSVGAPLTRPDPPVLSLPPAEPVVLETGGGVIAEDSMHPAPSAAGYSDSIQVPADTTSVGIDSSEVSEQQSSPHIPDR